MTKCSMKRCFLIVCLLVSISAVFAQTQHGYVKTRGRMNVNGTVVPGTRLTGATITFKGRSSVTSGTNGVFTFAVPNKTFCITNVQKKGYQLYDNDLLGRNYNYSSNDLLVVMDTPDNVLADRLESEKKIRRTLRRQLQEKEDEIVTLKEQQKITEEQYHKQLQELYATQENNERLISEMAERYSTLDFDQMDDFQRRVAAYIQNGELTRADSLLNTKGSMEERSAELDRMDEAIKADKEDIVRRQKLHEESIAMKARVLEDFAADCYSRYEMCLMQHKNDSASYWLELRASKDTLNCDWQIEAGDAIWKFQENFVVALRHYVLAFNISKDKDGEINRDVAKIYNKLGRIYFSQSKERALDYFQKALDIQNQLFGDNHIDKVETYRCMSEVYKFLKDETKATKLLQEALDIATVYYGEISWEVADIYSAMGSVYDLASHYGKAVESYTRANSIREKLSNKDDVHMVNTHLTNARLYHSNPALYIKHCLKALDLLIQNFGEYYPQVATVCFMIGSQYNNISDYDNALLYVGRAARIYEKQLGENHESTKAANESIGYILMKYEYEKEIKRMNNDGDSPIVKEFKSEMVYTATLKDTNNPNLQKMMEKENIVLEYCDWTINSDKSLYLKVAQMIEKPKSITVIIDGIINQQHIEDTQYVMINYKKVGVEEKQRILKAYKEWKEKQ